MIRSVRKKSGFSLVELLLVVGIIGILAAIAIPQFAAYRAKAFCAAVKADLANYAIAAEAYFTDYDAYTSAVSQPGISFNPTQGVVLAHGTASPGMMGFTIAGSHENCDADRNGVTDTFTWDSARGGIQFN